MSEFVQNLVNALSLGSLYALFALGIAVIFGIMGLINFAHGELIMIGGYAIVLISAPFPVTVLISGALVVLVALAMERLAFRPVRGAPPETLLITSFALSYLLQNMALLVIGPDPRSTAMPGFFSASVSVAPGVEVPAQQLITLGVTLVSLIVLTGFLQRTNLGMSMRATSEDFEMARILGIKSNKVVAVAFAISGALAALGAVLLAAQTGNVYSTVGVTPVLVAFVATIIGGIGSLRGAVMGGFVLGTLSVFLQAYLPVDVRPYRDAFVYGTVILLLVFRPNGIVASTSRTRAI